MTIQISSNPVTICNFIVALPKPIYASSHDYGFDFDKAELAEELIAPLPANLADQSRPKVEADEFEKVLHYFLS